jgi:hypothetical protein
MTSAGSTIRGMATELQTGDLTRRSCVGIDQSGFYESQVAGCFYNQTPEMALLSPPAQGLARPQNRRYCAAL